MLPGLQLRALFRDSGVDDIDFVAHVNAVRHGFFVGVLADHVLFEEAVCSVIGCGGQADQVGVEVVQHLPPQVVDGAVTLIDEDEVKELYGHLGVVGYRYRLFRPGELFGWIEFLKGFIQLFILENGVHALNGADTNLGILGHTGALEALHGIEFGELAIVVAGREGEHFLLGLFAEVFGVHQKQYPLAPGVLENPVHCRDGGVGLA